MEVNKDIMTRMIRVISNLVTNLILLLIIESTFGQTNIVSTKDQTCSPNCKNNDCTQHDGICSQGCTENFAGNTCNDCVIGRYGQDCSSQCPANCWGACDRSSGYCRSCNSNYAGITCDECYLGNHGQYCSVPCSSYCKDKRCSRGTGTCDSCPDGRFGDQCNLPCPPNCLQRVCSQKTGTCIGDCSFGYSGDMCCLKGLNCKSCLSASQCFECVSGKYGGTCNDECPSNCADSICEKKNGTCDRCIDGFHGDMCSIALAPGGGEDGFPVAAIGGSVAVGLVAIAVVVVVLIIIFRRRLARTSDDSNRQTDTPTYSNAIRVSAKETKKAVQDKTRTLQKYEQHQLKHHQKEVEYAEKVARIKHELTVIQEPINMQIIKDGATAEIERSTYESLNQDSGDKPYADLGTN